MLDAVHENFEQQGRPNPWKKSKRASRTSGRTLQDTNRLYRSILAQSDSTCVVYGMPKEAVRLGAVDKVLGLHDIPAAILGRISRKG